MGVLRDANLMSVVFMLMERGLKGDQIDRAMRQIVGNDWKEVKVPVWFKRLQNKRLIVHSEEEISIDDLEALVRGRVRLDTLYGRD